MSNLIAIVGRPNVGKSTLFNRLTETRDAIVDPSSGVTRDRHYGHAEWNGRSFSVIDTGGYVYGSDDVFEDAINKQVKFSIEEADILIFVVDVENGITNLDDEVAGIIRKSKKPHMLVVNKVDNNQRLDDVHEFYKFGLGDPYAISAMNGSGTGELLDDLVKILPEDQVKSEDLPKLTIVGQPNVGKSSLLNMLTGEERSIVTPLAGTTRDSIFQKYNKFGHEFLLVDTAGIRRKSRVHEDLEYYSVLRSVKAIEEADVCLLMIDAEKGLLAQDLTIFSLISRNKKGVVIVVNKWDLVADKETNTAKQYSDYIHKKLAPFTDVPILFTSVHEKQRIHKTLEVALTVYENRTKKIKTSVLNDKLLPIIEAYPPPAIKGKYVKIKYITQLPGRIPQFAFFCNLPQYIAENYRRFLENKMRELFDFSGTPISLFFRAKDKREA
ncbi:MAG: hypothetical protein RIQ89_1820 [Bacteroidota bacterium]|jgi:GTPase